EDGFDDVVVARAPADIAFELGANLALRRVWNPSRDVQCLHDHAGCAISALKGVIVGEGLLHGVQPAALRNALDRDNRLSITLDGEDRARLYRLPVQVHGAGTALAGVAANVRAGEMQPVAKEMRQQRPRLHLAAYDAAVDLHRDRAQLHDTSRLLVMDGLLLAPVVWHRSRAAACMAWRHDERPDPTARRRPRCRSLPGDRSCRPPTRPSRPARCSD